ncbi:hypothetical protein COCON_G00231510, partial [Conger conger]
DEASGKTHVSLCGRSKKERLKSQKEQANVYVRGEKLRGTQKVCCVLRKRSPEMKIISVSQERNPLQLDEPERCQRWIRKMRIN